MINASATTMSPLGMTTERWSHGKH